jgi:DNA mismatch repair protein MutS
VFEATYWRWHSIKEHYPETIVLLRVLDYYEAFDEDAKTIADICGNILLHFGTSVMAGCPVFCVDRYIDQLKNAGYNVVLALKEDENCFN